MSTGIDFGQILVDYSLCVTGVTGLGDSGGPLFFSPDEDYEVSGVLSWLDYIEADGNVTYYGIYSGHTEIRTLA